MYEKEFILNSNNDKINEVVSISERILENIKVSKGIDIESYLELFEKSSDISTMSGTFLELFNIGLNPIVKSEQEGEKIPEHIKDEMVIAAISNSAISSLISSLLEIIYLRKLLKESIQESNHWKDLLDLVCEEEIKTNLEESNGASKWNPEKKTIQ